MPSLKWGAGLNALKMDMLLSPILNPSGIKLMPEDGDKVRPAISSFIHSPGCAISERQFTRIPGRLAPALFDHV